MVVSAKAGYYNSAESNGKQLFGSKLWQNFGKQILFDENFGAKSFEGKSKEQILLKANFLEMQFWGARFWEEIWGAKIWGVKIGGGGCKYKFILERKECVGAKCLVKETFDTVVRAVCFQSLLD